MSFSELVNFHVTTPGRIYSIIGPQLYSKPCQERDISPVELERQQRSTEGT